MIGDNHATMAACEALLVQGFYAQGIRHPSVPRGTARLRITPMASHDEAQIDALADCLADVVNRSSRAEPRAARQSGARAHA